MKIKFLFFFLLLCQSAFAKEIATLYSLFLHYPERQCLIEKYQLKQSENKLEKYDNGIFLHYEFQSNKNDITRYDTEKEERDQEYHVIAEKDERSNIQISKTFFPNDFEPAILKLEQKQQSYLKKHEFYLDELFLFSSFCDDFIAFYKLQKEQQLYENYYAKLKKEQQIQAQLFSDRIISTETYLDLLEEIEQINEERYSLQKEFILANDFIKQNFTSIETQFAKIEIKEVASLYKSKIKRDYEKLKNAFRVPNIIAYFPEMKLSYSYNWRNNNQDWTTDQENEIEYLNRDTTEEYPEINFEIQVPFSYAQRTYQRKQYLKSTQKISLYELKEIKQRLTKFIANQNISKVFFQKKIDQNNTKIMLLQNMLEKQSIEAQQTSKKRIKKAKLALKIEKLKLQNKLTKLKLLKQNQILNLLENQYEK